MGAHFSPDGHTLAACVAVEGGGGGGGGQQHRHELRLFCTAPGRAWGAVLAARPLAAPQCLTSIQFSPTGEHVLVAYGRRHPALLVAADGGRSGGGALPSTALPPPRHTVLDVFSAPSLARVSSLASDRDEVNAAVFCPVPGGGLAYGTKEGRLRVFH
jgi:activator-of-BECN1-regulated-autophagy protein 1